MKKLKISKIQKTGIFFISITMIGLLFFYDLEKSVGYSLFAIFVSSYQFLMGLLLLLKNKFGKSMLKAYIAPMKIGIPSIYLAKYLEGILKSDQS